MFSVAMISSFADIWRNKEYTILIKNTKVRKLWRATFVHNLNDAISIGCFTNVIF